MSDNFTGDFKLSNHLDGLWKPGGCWLLDSVTVSYYWVASPT